MTGFDGDSGSLEDQLPDELRAEMARIHAIVPAVPAALDRAILRDARRSFARRRRAWLRARWVGGAAAAVITLAVGAYIQSHTAPSRRVAQQRPQLAQLADIDHDGRVDMLDAYIVARKIARHEPLDPAWDINGDGVIDQKDVDLIAHLAVHVSAEEHR